MSRVLAFARRFGFSAPSYPPIQVDPDLVRFRMRLVREEYEELMAELGKLTVPADPERTTALLQNVLKGVCDLVYVAEGTAVAFGLPFEGAFEEVHRSNMSKDPGETPTDKARKGKHYFAADMSKFVAILDTSGVGWPE